MEMSWTPLPIDANDPMRGIPASPEVLHIMATIRVNRATDPWSDRYLTPEDRKAWRNA